jgi:hypothetical protein
MEENSSWLTPVKLTSAALPSVRAGRIGIGHPFPETLEALKENNIEYQKQDIRERPTKNIPFQIIDWKLIPKTYPITY